MLLKIYGLRKLPETGRLELQSVLFEIILTCFYYSSAISEPILVCSLEGFEKANYLQ